MKKLLAIILIFMMLLSIGACSSDDSSEESVSKTNEEKSNDDGEPTKIVFWGLNPEQIGSGNKEMIEAFHEAYPNLEIDAQSTPGTEGNNYSTQDVTKLLAAIAAGNPPDVAVLDRFMVSQFASRGALSPLDPYMDQSDFDINEYEGYTVDEVTFDSKVWALPTGTDTRILYWNKEAFRNAGLDPEKPPKTWDELLEYSKKLTAFDADGKIEKIGFIPNYGNSWLYLYGFQNGGQFLSDDGRTAMLNQPEIVEALEFMVEGYDLGGGAEKINTFKQDLQGGADDPFINGIVGMKIDGNWTIGSIARYKPDLDFACAIAPTPDENTDPITWAGGWSYCIPKNAKHAKEGFEAIKYVTTDGMLIQAEASAKYNKEEQGSQYYIPSLAAHKPTAEKLFEKYVEGLDNPALKDAFQVAFDAKSVALHRPVSPVGGILWTEHERAIDKAIYKELTAQEALDAGNEVVQTELDKFWSDYDNK
ncbi:ABC transporter substrate-binding protein [Vallitalea okinawensis]|uniref:ABC transporter substrate-binding protein n=1 Tax=Vallitalea okinawensis TaxID=2078660 RepID=UPI000CFCABBC|nr:ABC transporter substrate-binding protein [Vallitalea okinawensis]